MNPEKATRIADTTIQALIIAALLFVLFGIGKSACADEPYLTGWAVRGQSFTRNYSEVTERLFEQRGYWGAEVLGRLPVERGALIGRVYNEGASGAYSYKDPSTWTRAVAEIALEGPQIRLRGRYGCAPVVGYGYSVRMQRGRILANVPDSDIQKLGPPPKYGIGLHCRDERLRMWVNIRAEKDEAVGPGIHPALTIHALIFGERGGLGVDFVGGPAAKFQIKVLARLFRWGE